MLVSLGYVKAVPWAHNSVVPTAISSERVDRVCRDHDGAYDGVHIPISARIITVELAQFRLEGPCKGIAALNDIKPHQGPRDNSNHRIAKTG